MGFLLLQDEAIKNPSTEHQEVNTHVALTGTPPSPRYFTASFRVRRVATKRRINIEQPQKAQLRMKAQELRNQGLSYPAIAKALEISVGSVWNLLNVY
jgi:hypothetical protein